MRRSPFRVLPILLTALVACAAFVAPAHAGEGDAPKREKGAHDRDVVRGLQAGIKSLRSLGGNERVILHMQELIAELQRSNPRASAKGADAEKRRMGQTMEVMMMAHRTLHKAGHVEQGEVMEHAVHALKMIWSGRSDEEAMAILATAPSQKAQANALFAAAEILGDQGQKRRAKLCAVLGKKFVGKQRVSKQGRRGVRAKAKKERKGDRSKERRSGQKVRGRPVDPEHGLEGLRERLTVLRLAMPALREGERRDAAEMLERALHTAELLLEERQDEEAQRIYRNTPSLIELSKLLHLSARLWLKYERPENAEKVAHLSRYYRLRAEGAEEAAGGEKRAKQERAEKERVREEAQRARKRTWALRQQEEMETRQRQARGEDERQQRRREHERRVRAHDRRGGGAEREGPGRRSSAEDETSRRIEELRGELNEVQRALRELMRELREIVRDR